MVTVFAEESLSQAVRELGGQNLGQVPVVDHRDPKRAVGLLRRDDIVRAYSQAMLGRVEAGAGHPLKQRDLRGGQLVETDVPPNSGLAGRSLAELHLPHEALVVSIERGRTTIVPRGNTTFAVGDHVIIFVKTSAVNQLHDYLAGLPNQQKPRPVDVDTPVIPSEVDGDLERVD